MKSKTIIISSLEESGKNGRGILTLYQEEDLLQCRLRLYNVEKLSKFCKLGIYHEKEVYTANLLEKQGVYESSFVGNFDIDKDFYTALINTENDNQVILAGGTYQGFYFNDYSVFSEEKPNSEIVEEKVDKKVETECLEDCDKCAKCKYKEFFYNYQEQLKEPQQAEVPQESIVNQEKQQENVMNVINSIIPQFEYIFNQYEADEELNSLISGSKFVKINENSEQYSIGAIYEADELKYICYAIKRDYNIKPPEELGEHYQWLPIDKEDPLSVGYYVVFQDAKDLKILEL